MPSRSTLGKDNVKLLGIYISALVLIITGIDARNHAPKNANMSSMTNHFRKYE